MAEQSQSERELSLPVTAYTVLGLISFAGEVTGGEVSGYDLRKWAMNMRYFYWSPAQSQIYLELRRLREHGFVDERTEEQKGRPDKRLYTLTESGRRVLRDWLEHGEVGQPLLKHSVALRLFFGHESNHERLREVLRDYAEWARQQQRELRALCDELAPGLPYPSLVAEWGVSYFGAELAAVDSALRGLDRMAEQPDPSASVGAAAADVDGY